MMYKLTMGFWLMISMGNFGFAILMFGYVIAFAGWGFSLWAKPEPIASVLIAAFILGGAKAFNLSLDAMEELDALANGVARK